MLPRLLHRGAAGLAEQGLRAGGNLRASYVSQLPGASLIELRKRPCQGCNANQVRGMAGHSKWSKIKHQKGANDKQKAIMFAKISVEITAAARQANGDMSNIRLGAALSRAKSMNVPKENIDAAVKRGVEGKGAANLEAVLYEGMGPGSCALIIEALTDNRKRTAPAIRHVLGKNGGSLGTSGSVSWMFDRKGVLEMDMSGTPERGPDDLIDAALEAGAEDVEHDQEDETSTSAARVYCAVSDLEAVRKGLLDRGWQLQLVEPTYLPKSTVDLTEDQADSLGRLLDGLDEDQDVQQVHHNARFGAEKEAVAGG